MDLKNKEPQFLAGFSKAEDMEAFLKTRHLLKYPAIAFVGRSNVGKSSFLNALTGLKIARVSQTPGRTREMNLFFWRSLILVDLPGYGYAKASKEDRAHWGKEMPKFLSQCENLAEVLVLADGRLGLTPDDLGLIDFLKQKGFPFFLVFTKMDKHKSKNEQLSAQKKLTKVCENQGISECFFVSSLKKNGFAGLNTYLLSLLNKAIQ